MLSMLNLVTVFTVKGGDNMDNAMHEREVGFCEDDLA